MQGNRLKSRISKALESLDQSHGYVTVEARCQHCNEPNLVDVPDVPATVSCYRECQCCNRVTRLSCDFRS